MGKNKKKNNNVQKKRQGRGKVSAPQMKLSRCAMKFALACVDPFNPAARGACIPSYPSPPSQKVEIVHRCEAVIGTQGVGFVAICAGISSDVVDLFYSTATYAGTAATGTSLILSANNTLNTGVTGAKSNLNGPYYASQFLTGAAQDMQLVSGRLVSVGVRIQYIGTNLNQAGLTYCYTSADHYNCSNISLDRISSFNGVSIEANSRQPCCLNMFASCTSDYEYVTTLNPGGVGNVDSNFPWSTGDTVFSSTMDVPGPGFTYVNTVAGGQTINTAAPVGIIYFTGVAGQRVFVEQIKHVEYIGPAVAMLGTPSDTDPEGLAHVEAALALVQQHKIANPVRAKTKPWEFFRKCLVDLWQKTAPIAVPMAIDALTAML